MALLVFLLWSAIELYVLVQVAGVIGAVPTVAAVVAMSVAGLWLMKVEGLGVLRRMGDQLDHNELPTAEAVNGVLIITGGLLMFIPGFVSGAIGLALLLPPVRALLRPLVLAWAQRRLDQGRAHVAVFSAGWGAGGRSFGAGPIYDADSHLAPRPDDRPPRPTGPPELGS